MARTFTLSERAGMDGNVSASLNALRGVRAGLGRVTPRRGRTALRSDILNLAFDALALWDILAVGSAAAGSAVFYSTALHPFHPAPFPASFNAAQLAIAGALLAAAVLRSRRARDAFDAFAASHLLSATCQRLTLWVALMLGIVFLTHSGGEFPRMWMTLWLVASFATVLGGRLLAVAALRTATDRGRLRDRVAVLGGGPASARLVRRLRASGGAGMELAGVFDVPDGDPAKLGAAVAAIMALGRRGEVDRVVVALPDTAESIVLDAVLQLRALDVEVSQCPPLAGLLGDAAQATLVGGAPMLVLASRPCDAGGLLLKTMFDRLSALLAIAFLSPLLAVIAVAVRLDSPGPALFRQSRHGWNNSEFQVFKFRTMRAAGNGNGAVQTRRGDARITRVGRFLRETSIDELPQLFNVLNGTMSLVGPRPHPVVMRTEDQLGEEIVAEYSHRHRVKPGITGWAQIHGHRGATETAAEVRARVACDLYYIDNWSFLLDLRILALTPFKIVFQRTNAF